MVHIQVHEAFGVAVLDMDQPRVWIAKPQCSNAGQIAPIDGQMRDDDIGIFMAQSTPLSVDHEQPVVCVLGQLRRGDDVIDNPCHPPCGGVVDQVQDPWTSQEIARKRCQLAIISITFWIGFLPKTQSIYAAQSVMADFTGSSQIG